MKNAIAICRQYGGLLTLISALSLVWLLSVGATAGVRQLLSWALALFASVGILTSIMAFSGYYEAELMTTHPNPFDARGPVRFFAGWTLIVSVAAIAALWTDHSSNFILPGIAMTAFSLFGIPFGLIAFTLTPDFEETLKA